MYLHLRGLYSKFCIRSDRSTGNLPDSLIQRLLCHIQLSFLSLKIIQIASFAVFLLFLSILSLLQQYGLEGSSNSRCDQFIYPSFPFIVRTKFLFSWTLGNFFLPRRNSPHWAKVSSLSSLHYHTQTHHTRQYSSGPVISPTQRPLPDNKQHSEQTDIHDSNGIRTRIPIKRAPADPGVRPLDHRDRLTLYNTSLLSQNWSNRSFQSLSSIKFCLHKQI